MVVVWLVYLRAWEVLVGLGRVETEIERWILNDGGLGMWIGVLMEREEWDWSACSMTDC